MTSRLSVKQQWITTNTKRNKAARTTDPEDIITMLIIRTTKLTRHQVLGAATASLAVEGRTRQKRQIAPTLISMLRVQLNKSPHGLRRMRLVSLCSPQTNSLQNNCTVGSA